MSICIHKLFFVSVLFKFNYLFIKNIKHNFHIKFIYKRNFYDSIFHVNYFVIIIHFSIIYSELSFFYKRCVYVSMIKYVCPKHIFLFYFLIYIFVKLNNFFYKISCVNTTHAYNYNYEIILVSFYI